MLEENVVKAAGTSNCTTEEELRRIIRDAGFKPVSATSLSDDVPELAASWDDRGLLTRCLFLHITLAQCLLLFCNRQQRGIELHKRRVHAGDRRGRSTVRFLGKQTAADFVIESKKAHLPGNRVSSFTWTSKPINWVP